MLCSLWVSIFIVFSLKYIFMFAATLAIISFTIPDKVRNTINTCYIAGH